MERADFSELPPTDDIPQPGFYRHRLDRKGVWLPVRIWVTQEVGDCGELLNPPTYHAELNGHSWDPGGLWLYCLAEAITESEFDYLLELGRWAAQHAPRDAYARPDKAVDWSTQPPHRYVKPVRRRRK